MSFKFLGLLKDAIGGSPENIRHTCIGMMFSQDTTEIFKDRMVSGDQWNPIGMRFFFVLEERLLVQSCHLINCSLYFAIVISSVSEVLFEDISLSLEAGKGRAGADSQTFRHTFESMGG
jgi:hypothetical protein